MDKCPNSAVIIPNNIIKIPTILKKVRLSVCPVESGIIRLNTVVKMGSDIIISEARRGVVRVWAKI